MTGTGSTEMRERINDYWSRRADEFGDARYREYLDDRADEWRALISRYMPAVSAAGGPVRALDLGTGGGLFAFMMRDLGCVVTGVDYSDDMLRNARANAERLGVDGVVFERMDAQELRFPDHSFDLVFTRNVTWTLPDPARAYAEMARVLDDGGALVNVDANYGACFREMDRLGITERIARDGASDYEHPFQSLAMLRERNALSDALYISDQERPVWDLRVLMGLGMEEFHIDLDVMRHAFSPRDVEHAPTPIPGTPGVPGPADGRIFLIVATKPR